MDSGPAYSAIYGHKLTYIEVYIDSKFQLYFHKWTQRPSNISKSALQSQFYFYIWTRVPPGFPYSDTVTPTLKYTDSKVQLYFHIWTPSYISISQL